MSLLKEITTTTAQPNLRKVDSSDAGANDVANKINSQDISFSLMRNTINSDGELTGSQVADYLERAAEINDEVDTIPFGLETDTGEIVKVYVNAEQADKFEEEMKKFLGLEDDIEEAIVKLAKNFDIVDVVWPKGMRDEDDELDDDSYDDLVDDDDDMEVVAEFDELREEATDEINLDEGADAFRLLNDLAAELKNQGIAGVSVVTGFDRSLTKTEMIQRHIEEEYTKERELAKTWIKSKGSDLPYWLGEDTATT